jgi:hypothetical protein
MGIGPRSRSCWALALCLLGVLAASAVHPGPASAASQDGAARSLRISTAYGCIDWGERFIEVVGQAAPGPPSTDLSEVRAAAEYVARRDLLARLNSTLHALSVDANQTVGQLLEAPAAAERRRTVGALIEAYEVTQTRYFSDGGVQMRARLPLDRGLAAALSENLPQAPQGAWVPTVVVVVKGDPPLACLAPRLLDADGNSLLQAMADPLRAGAPRGLPAYRQLEPSASLGPWAKRAKLLLRAAPYPGPHAADLRLEPADARRLRQFLRAPGTPAVLRLIFLLA